MSQAPPVRRCRRLPRTCWCWCGCCFCRVIGGGPDVGSGSGGGGILLAGKQNPTPSSHLQARGVRWALAGVSWAEGVVVLNKIKISIKNIIF